MGLDMYLYEESYKNNKIELKEVAYFRKINSIHGWFVKYIQDDIDNCAYYSLEGSKAIETKDASLIPPTKGFFFGSYEIDDYYWEDLQKAKTALSNLDFDKSYMYHSSW
jgi:hypothetical protein